MWHIWCGYSFWEIALYKLKSSAMPPYRIDAHNADNRHASEDLRDIEQGIEILKESLWRSTVYLPLHTSATTKHPNPCCRWRKEDWNKKSSCAVFMPLVLIVLIIVSHWSQSFTRFPSQIIMHRHSLHLLCVPGKTGNFTSRTYWVLTIKVSYMSTN